jgi:putative transposase
VFSPEEATVFVQKSGRRLGLEHPDNGRYARGRWSFEKKVDVVAFPVDFCDFAVDTGCEGDYVFKQKGSSVGRENMTAKLDTKNDVVTKPVDTMARCFKQLVPDHFRHVLDSLYPVALDSARDMLRNRDKRSSRDWPGLPSVVSKSLIAKYQRNKKCKNISNLVIPICGDKGRQVKIADGGIRVPALFQKNVIPVELPSSVVGHVRQVEFFKRDKQWLVSICVNTKCEPRIEETGTVGVDRNSVGNVAVMADVQTGKVFKLGIDPAGTKRVFRGRRKNLQKEGKNRLLKKINRKQSRRMTCENHRASKTVVDYAAEHRRAIVLENLGGVRKEGSKIKRYSEKNQWAFFQLETFIKYKAALRGVPVVYVNPAYTSQMCSRCGSIHKPSGKRYECAACGHKEHRDANAAFNIGRLGANALFGAGGDCLSVQSSGSIGGAYAGKELGKCRS